ncbi:MAG TPA: IS4 family transposase [Deltaproteobacteria bacterium]|nr:IS4 family transposase [Deltaproteobacteria bacterium]
MLICGQNFTDEVIQKIRVTVESEPTISRRALSLRVCEWLDWRTPNGKPKEMSCRVALLRLHRQGIVKLPECNVNGLSAPKGGKKDPPIVQIEPVRCNLKDLGGVELIRVGSRESKASRVWNALMDRYHYLGAGPLCGAQMRYLIKSPYGWLGGLAFSGAAWRVEARDGWIGWGDWARKENLSKVVCNSRFLILPQVKVSNLASHVLSLCVRQLPQDWLERYGFEPVLLETFVERDRFQGTCYRAANWQYVGTTCGRGRQDRDHTHSVPIKDVYVFPMRKDARRVLCCEPLQGVVRCEPEQGVETQDWAEDEFGEADLGDRRLTKRLVGIVRDFYARPQASVPQACQTRAKTKAAYRFFDHPKMGMDKVLEQHYEATLARVGQGPVVLAVQDTTSLNYSTHPATENLGPIGSCLDGIIGLLLHDTMAFNPDGTPLGLLDVQCWARDPEDFGKKTRRHELPIEQKESNRWLISFRKVAEAQRRSPKTTFVSVGDREADIYELFELALRQPSAPKLLVRASHNRLLAEGQGHLWEKVSEQEISGIQEVLVPRRGNRPARVARPEVRFAEITLKPPKRKPRFRELTIWAVLAQEVEAPQDVEPIEWMLLTTCQVTTFDEAIEKLAWYAVRWGIEVYHRTLKSGCKIEERQLGHADRIETCLAIDLVVAWRIFHLTKLGRETPDVPCTVFFEESEWKSLTAYITQNPIPPDRPPTLREAIRMVASLGGFLGRNSDGEPGTKSLWLGLQRLDDITTMWKVMTNLHVPYPQEPPVSSNPGYG